MTIEYIKKDITTITHGVIAHGVNCSMKMGSGVALVIKKKWPSVYERFMMLPGKDMLGKVDYIQVSPNLTVANVYTQQKYGYDSKVYANIHAIESGIKDIICNFYSPIYMPKIGCGLGGLNWEKDVEPIINNLSNEYPYVRFYICEL